MSNLDKSIVLSYVLSKFSMTIIQVLKEVQFVKEGRKIKVYLDTSVISYLDQQDAPEKMQETQEVRE